LISNHHLAATCSLGLAVAEFLVCDGGGYARTVITAAQILGRALADHGLTPQAADRGFTTCHQLWVRTTPAGIGAAIAANRLEAAGIAVNVLTDLPGLHGEPALRLGTAEAVWQGLTPDDMAEVAKLITDAVFARRPAGQIAERVAELRAHRVSPYRLPAATPDAELTFRLVTSALASLEKSPGIERVAVP
jgi:glycine/serine hydroxymethyltransferase